MQVIGVGGSVGRERFRGMQSVPWDASGSVAYDRLRSAIESVPRGGPLPAVAYGHIVPMDFGDLRITGRPAAVHVHSRDGRPSMRAGRSWSRPAPRAEVSRGGRSSVMVNGALLRPRGDRPARARGPGAPAAAPGPHRSALRCARTRSRGSSPAPAGSRPARSCTPGTRGRASRPCWSSSPAARSPRPCGPAPWPARASRPG